MTVYDFSRRLAVMLATTTGLALAMACRCSAIEYMTPQYSIYPRTCISAEENNVSQMCYFDDAEFSFRSENGTQKEYYGKVRIGNCTDSLLNPYPVEKGDGVGLYAPNYTSGLKYCSQCKRRYDPAVLYDAEVWMEDAAGRTIIPKRSGFWLNDITIPSRDCYLCFHFVQKPKEYCSGCGAFIGGEMSFGGIYIHETLVKFISMPVDAVVEEGKTAAFEVNVADYNSGYHWQKKVNGAWVNVTNGAGIYGERYSGAESNKLTVNKVSSAMYGMELRCVLKGSLGLDVYTDVVTFKAPEPAASSSSSSTSSSSSSSSSTGEATPVITPGTGSSTSYRPSDSSSAYVAPSGGSGDNGKTSRESNTSHTSSGGGDSTYKGKVDMTPTAVEEKTKITALDLDTSGSTSSSGSGGSTGKRLNTKNGSSGTGASSKSSSTNGSSTGRYSGKLGNNYVTRNGVLYIVDDDSAPVGTEGEENINEQKEESHENEEAYSASDLADYAKLQSQNKEKGFWQTIPGYVTIGAIALAVLLAILFFLFFGVIVFGEVEEHDEVFELCLIRLMKRREGEWCVDLGSAFDDNAVLKLRIGLLFAVIFDGWDITCQTHGVYEGHVEAVIGQPLMVYRKKIRRNV